MFGPRTNMRCSRKGNALPVRARKQQPGIWILPDGEVFTVSDELWSRAYPIGMSSAIYHTDTVELMSRLMKQRGIPVVLNSFHGKKGDNYTFGPSETPGPPRSEPRP